MSSQGRGSPAHAGALLPLLAASLVACGGTGGPKAVPADDFALVGDQPITRAALASMLAANRQSYRLRGQLYPAVGTTAFLTARNKLLDQLVQEAELEQHADCVKARAQLLQIRRR